MTFGDTNVPGELLSTPKVADASTYRVLILSNLSARTFRQLTHPNMVM